MNLAYAAICKRHSDRKILLSLLAFLAFLACASVEMVARASPAPSQGTTRQDDLTVERNGPHCRRDRGALPPYELSAAEFEDLEDDASLHTLVASLAAHFAPIANCTREVAREVFSARVPPPLVCSALPRGPPMLGVIAKQLHDTTARADRLLRGTTQRE